VRIAWPFFLASALSLAAADAPAADAGGCETKIAAVMEEIAGRDLDTSRGPPLDAFLAHHPAKWIPPRGKDEAHTRR